MKPSNLVDPKLLLGGGIRYVKRLIFFFFLQFCFCLDSGFNSTKKRRLTFEKVSGQKDGQTKLLFS